MHIGTGITKL